MRSVRIQTLQWTVGVLCALFGLLALITPHQFNNPGYATFLPYLNLWGAAFVLVGGGLIGVASLGGDGRRRALIHTCAAVVLGVLALSFGRLPAWLGLINYGLLALAIGLAPFVRARPGTRSIDLLYLVLALSLGADAVLMLLAQIGVAAPALDSARPSWSLEPELFGVGAACLMAYELWPRPRPDWLNLAQLLPIAALLSHLVASNVLGLHLWTSIVYYGGFGVILAALPMVRRWKRIDARSLEVRLALALAVSAATPLLLAAAFTGAREEQAVVTNTLAAQETLARVVAGQLASTAPAPDLGTRLAAILSDAGAGPGTTAYVVDAQLELIAGYEPRPTSTSNISQRAAVQALVDSRSSGAVRAADPRRAELLSGYAPVPGRGWGVVVERPVSVVLANTWQTRETMLLAVLIGTALVAATGVLVAVKLAAPEAAERARAHAEVQRLNTALERRVADRTADLEVAIENLHAQISQRTHAEDALRDSEARYRLLVELSPEPIFVHAAGRFVYVNPAAARLFGAHDPAELMGRSAFERVHPEWRSAVRNRTTTLQSGGGPAHAFELRVLRLDGSTLDVESTAAEVTFDGAPAVQVILRDVSERKAMERMKDEFISVVSHELRTPLTSIRGSLGLLAGGVLGPLSSQGQRMLEIAVGNTDRLIRLLNDVLDLERMRAGRVTLQRSHISAAELLGQAMAEMRGLAERSGVDLVLSSAAGVVDADADRLVQVLTNLLSNAIKFSPANGHVFLTASVAGLGVRFSVLDQGRGIPSDMFETIFERFSQVDASDAREKGGTGLGLAICRTIVEAHGGRIWAEPVSAAAGSRFVFELPAAVHAAQAA